MLNEQRGRERSILELGKQYIQSISSISYKVTSGNETGQECKQSERVCCTRCEDGQTRVGATELKRLVLACVSSVVKA